MSKRTRVVAVEQQPLKSAKLCPELQPLFEEVVPYDSKTNFGSTNVNVPSTCEVKKEKYENEKEEQKESINSAQVMILGGSFSSNLNYEDFSRTFQEHLKSKEFAEYKQYRTRLQRFVPLLEDLETVTLVTYVAFFQPETFPKRKRKVICTNQPVISKANLSSSFPLNNLKFKIPIVNVDWDSKPSHGYYKSYIEAARDWHPFLWQRFKFFGHDSPAEITNILKSVEDIAVLASLAKDHYDFKGNEDYKSDTENLLQLLRLGVCTRYVGIKGDEDIRSHKCQYDSCSTRCFLFDIKALFIDKDDTVELGVKVYLKNEYSRHQTIAVNDFPKILNIIFQLNLELAPPPVYHLENGHVDWHKCIEHEGGLAEAKQPDGLSVQLLDYQKQDLHFMLDQEAVDREAHSCLWVPVYEKGDPIRPLLYVSPILRRFSIRNVPKYVSGGMLCDEMGLGKTVVCLALVLAHQANNQFLGLTGETKEKQGPLKEPVKTILQQLEEERIHKAHKDLADIESDFSDESETWERNWSRRATLVICHANLVDQWIKEAKKMSGGSLKILKYNRNKGLDEGLDVIVTTYRTLISEMENRFIKDICRSRLKDYYWWRIILDESHSFKRGTKTEKALRPLRSRNKWCVTGTPFEKGLVSVSPSLEFLGFRPYYDYDDHDYSYHLQYDESKKMLLEAYSITSIIQILKTFTIRHEKSCVRLPEKTEKIVYIERTEKSGDFYGIELQKLQSKYIEKVNSLKPLWEIRSLLDQQRARLSVGFNNFENIESERKKLENVDSERKKKPKSKQKKNKIPNANFSFWGDPESDRDKTPEKPKKKQKKKISNERISFKWDNLESGKLRVVLKSLETDVAQPGTKILVFTEFLDTISALSVLLTSKNIAHNTIHGSMLLKNRKASLKAFSESNDSNVLVASIRSAGVGINIVAANKVYIVEPSMNKSWEEQAIGRCWRLGQMRQVEVTRFVIKNSLEENIMNHRKDKSAFLKDPEIEHSRVYETNDGKEFRRFASKVEIGKLLNMDSSYPSRWEKFAQISTMYRISGIKKDIKEKSWQGVDRDDIKVDLVF